MINSNPKESENPLPYTNLLIPTTTLSIVQPIRASVSQNEKKDGRNHF